MEWANTDAPKQYHKNDYANKATKFVYDSHDKLVRIELADGSTTTYEYTLSGRIKKLTDSQGSIEKTYDSRGRLKTQTNPNNETITYGYDGVGNIIEIETPSQTISKTYDALSRLKTVTDSQGMTTYTYDAIGRQSTVAYPNGTTTNYSYDSRNRVTKIEHKNSAGDVLQSFSYTLDNVGNRTKVVEATGRTVDYAYNSVNQLISETVTNDPSGNDTVTSFTYDLVGNMLTKTVDGITTNYVYNANDQLTQQGSTNFTYDDNGNLITKGTTSYAYDDKNRLVKTITPTKTIEYGYDAENNRIVKSVDGTSTNYLIDANTAYAQVITESKDGTDIHYTYGNDLISNGTNYFLMDALGSTRGLVDINENLSDEYSYTPYGILSHHSGDSNNSFLYTGEQFDSESEDYYLRARYYSPNSSRFISRDTYNGTSGSPITQNHYLYGNANPMSYIDPSGYFSISSTSLNISNMGVLAGRAISMTTSIARSAITQGARGISRRLTRSQSRDDVDIVELTYLLTIARLSSRLGEDSEEDKIPIQVYGYNHVPEHQNHIFGSMLGIRTDLNGKETMGHKSTPFILHRRMGKRNDSFLNIDRPTKTGYVRDEYPYNKTYEGGETNYFAGRVSIKYVDRKESSRQGNFINRLYREAPLRDGDAFIVIPMGAESGFFDKKWNWNKVPKY